MEVLQRTANRGSIATGAAYEIDNSLKFESDNGEICKMNFSTGGSNQIFTWSFWCKRTELSTHAIVMGNGVSGNDAVYCEFSSDALRIVSTSSASFQCNLITDRLFRDTSAWYHIVVAFDTTQATSSNRVKLYVNGVQETSFGTATYPSQNANTFMGNGTGQVQVGSINSSGSSYNGYLTEVFCIEGQQLAATDFGEFDEDTGIWKPKAYTGTFGTNYAFYLKFDNAASLGADSSGLGNNFTLTNITSIDQALDTPTNNFCTMNMNSRRNGNIKNQEGGTKVTTDGGSDWCSMNATMGVSSGKWYWEVLFENDPGDTNTVMIGIAGSNDRYIPSGLAAYYLGNVSLQGSIGWYFVSGGVFNGSGTWTGPNYGDIAMIALDMDNLKLYYGVNGTWGNSSDPETNTNGINIASSFSGRAGATDIILPSVSVYQGNKINSMNFGGYRTFALSSAETDADGWGSFEYAPPSGYYALCTKNLAEYG